MKRFTTHSARSAPRAQTGRSARRTAPTPSAFAMVRDQMKFLTDEDKSWMLRKTVERVWNRFRPLSWRRLNKRELNKLF